MEKKKKRNKIKHFPYHHSFRCTKETQAMLEYLLEITKYNKSFLLRECIQHYFDSVCDDG